MRDPAAPSRETPLWLSVIVPVHNGGATLRTCLQALAASGRTPEEIIVADDASTDDTAQIAREAGAKVVVLEAASDGGGPQGPAAARNRAAVTASGDILVFIDADVAVHPDTLGRFEEAFRQDPDLVAAFGSYDTNPPAPEAPSRYKNLLHHYVHHKGGRREAGTFWAGCGAVRRQAFEAVGGFDARAYARPCIEDIELGIRLRDDGRRILLDPAIQGTHLKRWTLSGLVRTDILARAIPWTRLLAERGGPPPRDLNLDARSRLSAAAVLLGALWLLAGIVFPVAWIGVPLALLAMTALNADLFRFFHRHGGTSFLLATVALHALYLLYSSVTFVLVTLQCRADRVFGRGDPGRSVLAFYIALFLLLHGGRMGTSDALAQLQVTTALATTGWLGSPVRPGENLWMRNPDDGLFYEYHDIGAIGLMLPSAWIGATLSSADIRQDILNPSLLSRTGVAVSYALLAALGCLFMFRLWALFVPTRAALLLSLIFATCTIYWPYSKYSFDVIAGAAFACAVLYYSARLLTEAAPTLSTALKLGVSLALATAFRFYFGPILFIGLAGTLFYARRRLTWGHVLLCLTPFALSLALGLWYNAIRTGNPLRTGAMGNNAPSKAMRPSIWPGLYGLILSPNRGLLVFAPIHLLLFTLPFLGKRIAAMKPLVALAVFYGAGAALYTCAIATLSFWGSFGWGPRYLVPILPILYLGVGISLITLWPERRHRVWLTTLLGLSFLLNAAPVIVNWHLAVSEHAHAPWPYARLPYQHMVVWQGIGRGLQGKPLPAPAEIGNDPLRSASARFPDLWLARALERPSLTARAGGLTVAALLSLLGLTSLTRLLRREESRNAYKR